MQSSVNQIASVFRGNPAPLQQRVNQDKQANQGIPTDLKELLALQILTEERDSMSRQQAIQQLQQAGQQPTVAQSLQQRAQQAIQSRAVQEQQKQQGLQGLMQQLNSGAVPENTPQPQRQPQGIDQLPAGMGEFSGGGIVAFEEGGSVEEKYRREAEEMGEGTRMKFSPDVQEYAKRLSGTQGASEDEYANRERQLMLDRARELASERPAPERSPNVTREVMNRVGPMTAPKFVDPRRADAGQGLPSALAAENPEARMPPPAASARPAAAKTPAAPAIPANKPVISAAPAAGGLGELITPDVRTTRQQLMIDAMNLDPAAAERKRREAYEREVGAPQTAGLDQLAQELKDRRARMQERNKNIDPLVERLTAIANAPRGQKWMYSMLAGNAAVDKAQQARETQDFEMLKQIVEQQNKIEDVKRGYRTEVFNIGDKERSRVYKDAFDAAKELGADDRAATQLAQEATLRLEQMRLQNSNRPFDLQGEYAKAMLNNDPKRANILLKAMSASGEAKRPGLDMDLRKKFSELPDVKIPFTLYSMLKSKPNPTEKDLIAIQTAEANLAKLARANNIDPSQLGLEGAATSGKVPPPPPGFKLN